MPVPADPRRRAQERNQFLDAAESRARSWDGFVGGRKLVVRGNRAILVMGRDRDQNPVLDLEGTDRDEIGVWLDGALRDADRRAPRQDRGGEVQLPQGQPTALAAPVQPPAPAPRPKETTSEQQNEQRPTEGQGVQEGRRREEVSAPVGSGPRVLINQIGRDGLTEAERRAGKAPLDLVTVRDAYGDSHRVSQSAIDGDRPMLRRYNAKGEAIDGPMLARENIDTDGTAVTETFADQDVIGGGRGTDQPMKSESALRQAIRRRGQKVDDFVIRQVNGGFVAVRKTALKAQGGEPSAPADRIRQIVEAENETVPPGYRIAYDAERSAMTLTGPRGVMMFSAVATEPGALKLAQDMSERARIDAKPKPPAGAVGADGALPVEDGRKANEGTPGVLEIRNMRTGKTTTVDTRPSQPEATKPEPASPFAAAGFTRSEKTGDWVLEGKRGARDGRWIIRAHPGGRFKVLRFTDQVGSVAVPTREVGIFDTAQAAIAAVQEDRGEAAQRSGSPANPGNPAPAAQESTEVETATEFTDALTGKGDAVARFADGRVYRLTFIGEGAWGVIVRKDGVILRVLGEAGQKLRREQAVALAVADAFPAAPESVPQGDPKMPAGLTLGSVKKMTKAEAARVPGDPDAAGGDWGAGDFHAVISRASPYAVFGGYGKTRADAIQDAIKRAQRKQQSDPEAPPEPTPAPNAGQETAPAPKPKKLKGLTDAENAELAALEAEFAKRIKNQLNTGLDPEMVGMAFRIGSLYVRAGRRRFRQLIDAMIERMGLTLEQAQPYARNAYNQIRDDLELAGEDVADMDTAQDVVAEIRKMRIEESKKPAEDTISEGTTEPEAQGDERGPRTDGDARDAASQSAPVPTDVGAGSGDAGGPGNLRQGQDGPQPDSGRGNERLEGPGGTGRRAGEDRSRGTGLTGDRPRNYRIPPGGLNDTRGEKTRAKDSIEAIRLLKQIEKQGRRATPAEQERLARYAGAGSLNPAVPNSDGRVRAGYEDIAADLQSLVSKDEMETIARTTQYAFYTSEEIVRGMWTAAERLGFKGGTVFEPGMGIGHFLGMAPDSIADRMTYRGIELDSITARIARQLYPEATVQNQDYTAARVPQGFYDLAIGNPPFAGIEIKADKRYPQGFLLHDYFFAKTLDAVRPGGLLAFVTSEGTMNKMEPAARQYLADRADLVGAIRLPNTAFKGSAGTEVTTDVIFLRKRAEGEPAGDQSWVQVDMVPLPGLEGGRMTEFKVNRYFTQNPDMILGKQGGFGTMRFRGQYAVVPNEGERLSDAFAAAVRRLPADVMTDRAYDSTQAQEEVDPDSGQTKVGSFYVRNGELWQYDGSVGRRVKRKGSEGGTVSAADYRKAVQFVSIRDALRATYAADLAEDGPAAEKARAELNQAYDEFVAEHGPINKAIVQYRPPTSPVLERARAVQREEALEQGLPWSEGSFDPTPFIDASMTADPGAEDDGDAPSSAVLGQEGKDKGAKKYTWTAIAKMRKEVRERLGPAYDDGTFDASAVEDTEIIKRVNLSAIMDDPEVWRIAALEKYNTDTGTATKTKVFRESILARQAEPQIRDAKDALNYAMATRGFPDLRLIAEKAGLSEESAVSQLDGLIFNNPETGRWENRDTYLSGNVRKKLEAARSVGGPAMERNIAALESVLPRDLTEFDVTATPGMPWIPTDVMQDFARTLGMAVKIDRASAGGKWVVDGDKDSTEAKVTWGTEDFPFPDLLEKVLNRTVIKVQRTAKNADGTTTTWLDEAATQAANEKAEAIRERFAGWVWQDGARKERLLRLYNDRYNSTVAPTFDGSYLTTPGIKKGWEWRPHQLRAIARILQSGSTYLAHAVGAGKTSEMIAAAMEARRLGIARKPMFTVPNHMLGQFAAEFYDHYPTANIIVADDRRFHTDRRRQFIADAATNDYDAIILTHSSFQKIPVSDALNDEFVRAEIERFDEAIRSSKQEGDRITTKEMERAKEKLEQRLRGARDDSRVDAQLTFEEMGVDMLFVDEAHLFRKLDFATQLGALKGITPSGSKMSWDLFLKTRHLDRVNPGRGLVLASGTPITNTMAELYTISRYIQHDTLEDQGLLDFDSWAQSFGETAIDYEPDAAGNYKAVSRFSKFVNTRDLSLMIRERMDTVIPEDLAKYVVRPKLKGGGRIAVPVPRSPAVEAYQGELAARMKAIEERKGPPKKGDDNHLVVIGDGIAAATDMRLIDHNASGRDSKLTRLADNVLRIWRETKDVEFRKPDEKAMRYSDEVAARGPAAQMVFADIQRRPGKSSFDTHEFIRDHLIRNGVPAEQIALFRDFKNTEAKRRLFRRVNEGEVRVLIGSAKAMGTGVNAQERLIAMHNLDPHWYPALDEQRVGRILRQGNMNPEIQVFDYATEGTYDSTMWQMMGRKARTIEDFLRGDPNINEMEDVGAASVFEQLAGMTTPDPRILRLKELQEDVKKLGRRRANAASERRALEQNVRDAERNAAASAERAEQLEAVVDRVVDLRGKSFSVSVGDQTFDDRKEFGETIEAAASAWADGGAPWPQVQIASVGDLPVVLRRKTDRDPWGAGFTLSYTDESGQAKGVDAIIEVILSDEVRPRINLYSNPVDTAKALTQALLSVRDDAEYYRRQEAAQIAKGKRDAAALASFKGFTQDAELAEKEARLKELRAQLDAEEAARQGRAKAEKGAPTPRESRFPRGGVPAEGLRDVSAALGAEMRRAGLAGKVSVRLVRGLMDAAGVPIQGRQQGARIEVNPESGDGALGTLRHEIVHALRDAALWGEPYGLFTRGEWQGLVRSARADRALLSKVQDAYPDLGIRDQIEEVIAEQYRRWARNMDQRSGVERAFQKMRAFLQALANALRGQGFQSAALTFERIASGGIGGRGPGGPAGAGRTAEQRAYHGTPHDFDRFSTAAIGTGEGAQAFGWGLYFASQKLVAKWYRDHLASQRLSLKKGGDGSRAEKEALDAIAFDFNNAMDETHPSQIPADYLQHMAEEAEREGDTAIAAAFRRIDPKDLEFEDGRLFEVEIPEDSDLLDWDRQIADQPDRIYEAVKKAMGGKVDERMTGQEAYEALSRKFRDAAYAEGAALTAQMTRDGQGWTATNRARNAEIEDRYRNPDRAASMALRNAGIPGHRFLDGRSRSPGEGSHNYVIYDDAAIQVMGKESRGLGQPRSPDGRFASHAAKYSRQLLADDGPVTPKKERGIIGQILTDAMGGLSSRYNLLALVPSEPLLQELAKNLPSAQTYLRLKHAMSAMRNDRQAKAAGLVEKWRGAMVRAKGKNADMMALMHDATRAGVDPAEPFAPPPKKTWQTRAQYDALVAQKRETHAELAARWEKLPKALQGIYREVREAYREISTTETALVAENVKTAMEVTLKRARLKHADEMRRIDEDGLTGAERDAAIAKADAALDATEDAYGKGAASRLRSLRLMFEQGKVDEPYFPLMRYGNYYATVKDRAGKIVSFSRFETEREMMRAARELRADNPGMTVKTGLMRDKDGNRTEVDPNFVADVQEMLGAAAADTGLMDSIWQRYLETLPDFSIRKSRLHRKGTPGFSADAFRNFARQSFHSAHQLARLKYGMQMQMALDDAAREADAAPDPTRATAVVNEMGLRHQWVMNPQSAAWSTVATSAAFVYYLGATPAAALVNISQSVVVGIPVLSAAFKKGSIGGASRHMMRALRDFGMGKGSVAEAKNISPQEREAVLELERRGVISKTQSHDLAGVAESGMEYSDTRQRIMAPIAWMFHQAERLNREITGIAAYRMARENGFTHEDAIDKAALLTWKTHFNYEGDSRPRVQQDDFVRVMTVFKNYQLNMLYRLFRDTHQAFQGATEAERREARAQLIGITGMMMTMTGVSGTWGYALITTLLGLFVPGGADEIEEEVKTALVNTLGRDMAGLVLQGVPGTLTGINLSQRMGMPELWFRRPDRQQEGDELYQYWAEQVLGAVPGMVQNAFRGFSLAMGGEVWRGVETASPKAIRDLMRGYRYSQEGVTTLRGNPIIENVSPAEALTQALGFTPSRVSERYQTNRWMRNTEQRIVQRRRDIIRQIGDDVREGRGISAASRDALRAFNAEFPEYPITSDTIRQSLRSRARGERETIDGLRLNARLDQRIRGETAPMINQE